MSNKRIGIKSSAQDNFLEPLNVTGLTATDVGTARPYSTTFNGTAGQGGAVSLSWTLPATSPAATSYDIKATRVSDNATVTVNSGSSAASYTFQGLESNVSYTFTIIPKNASGSAKTPNTVSGSTLSTTVPQAPQSPSATAGVNQNTINWVIGATGGKSLTKHDVNGSDGTSSLNLAASATSTTIADTANTSQTYTITATNGNGTSLGATTGTVTTLAPFFPPFFPPYFPFFPPFFPPYFPFFPFFPPYFAPPFFPPFFPFFPFFPPYFAPPFFPPFFPFFPFFPPYFAAPFFPPFFPAFCVHGDTPIRTPEGYVLAKDIKVGDTLSSYRFNELPLDRSQYVLETWSSESITEDQIVETTVESIKIRQAAVTVMLNEAKNRRFSLEHMLLARREDTYMFIQAGTLKVGDFLVYDINNRMTDVKVESIGYLDETVDVYDFSVTPYDLFIAGDVVAHNKKGAFQGPTRRDNL
jgi:hypothetical protein